VPLPPAPWVYLPYIFVLTLAVGVAISFRYYRRSENASTAD
jgi:hypothetical protein